MLNMDMFGHYRFFVRGEIKDLQAFTINLTWYHSALAEIGSIADDGIGGTTLNLIVKNPEREEDIRKICKDFGVIGFSSFEELKEMA